MKTKTWWAITLTALLLLAGMALGQAGLDPAGRPAIKPGEGLAYLIWTDANGWHARWTTGGAVRHFSGSIQAIGGALIDAKASGTEGKSDRVSITPALIKFSTKTAAQQDGVDFKLGPRTRKVRFDLMIDGKPRPDRVFVGKGRQHPTINPFDLLPR